MANSSGAGHQPNGLRRSARSSDPIPDPCDVRNPNSGTVDQLLASGSIEAARPDGLELGGAKSSNVNF